MNVLSAGPAPQADRPATEILHDEASVRLVAFTLNPAQRIPPHRSNSTVIIHVTHGSGEFQGGDTVATLQAGQSAVFAPGETHGMVAGPELLRFIAVITPRPGG
jgi:quercetin dioxygenase-like cupin family protein